MASEFALYEKALPGAGDRILTIGEKEQAGRLEENRWRLRLDERLVKGHNLRAGLAQPMSFVLVLVSLYYSNSLIMHNHDAAGIALGTTTIGAILAAFLGAKYIQPKEDKEPADAEKGK